MYSKKCTQFQKLNYKNLFYDDDDDDDDDDNNNNVFSTVVPIEDTINK